MAKYIGLFEGDGLITKEMMCQLLNLDLKRPNLMFDEAEIAAAYRARALRFHPDKQPYYDKPIPKEICTLLMVDIARAREHLLKGENNIPGKGFAKAYKVPQNSNDIMTQIISMLQSIKSGAKATEKTVYWINLLSNHFLFVVLLSTYSNSKLNFRFVNAVAPYLQAIQPYLKNVDGSAVAGFLRFLKEQLSDVDKMDTRLIKEELAKVLPTEFTNDPKFDLLISSIKDSGQALKELLTDEFLNKVQNLIKFWANLVATFPAWKTITGVYFVSLFFTAGSLPKFANSLKEISAVIIQNKGVLPFILVSFPMYLLSSLILPVNIALHLSLHLTWIALKASLSIIINAAQLLKAALSLPFSEDEEALKLHAFLLFEALVNIAVRLTINVLVQTLDVIIYILTDTSPLGFILDAINQALDSMLAYLRPAAAVKKLPKEDGALVFINNEKPKENSVKETPKAPPKAPHFFPKAPAPWRNEVDTWLDDFLIGLAEEDQPKPGGTPTI